jgi:hypothetical protein
VEAATSQPSSQRAAVLDGTYVDVRGGHFRDIRFFIMKGLEPGGMKGTYNVANMHDIHVWDT